MTRPHTDVDAYRLKKLGVQVQADRDAANRQRDRALRPRLDEIRNAGSSVGENIGAVDFVGPAVSVNRVGEVATVTVDPAAWLARYANGTTSAPAGSPDASTTSTSTYATAFSDTWLLPAGTWTVSGFAACAFIHSGSAAVDFFLEVNGSGALTHTPNLSSTVYSMWIDHGVVTGIVSDGVSAITVKVQYRSNTAGTTTPQAPKAVLTAIRTV